MLKENFAHQENSTYWGVTKPVYYNYWDHVLKPVLGKREATATRSLCTKSSKIFQVIGFLKFSSVTQSCLTLCDPMDCSTPGLPVHHQLPEFTQTHVIESVMPSNHLIFCHPLLLQPSIFPIFSWVSSFHKVAKGLELPCIYNSL